MSLLDLYKKYESVCDKGTTHSYIQNFYQHQFKKYKDKDIVIVEAGVLNGGSIMLYNDYFSNAKIFGIDVQIYNQDFVKWCENKPNVTYIQGDAYDDKGIATLPEIDIFIDDGPHSTESQVMALQKYLPKMRRNGLFVIEDIQDDYTMSLLYNMVPEFLKPHTYPVDYRFDRNRYDDRMFVIKLPE